MNYYVKQVYIHGGKATACIYDENEIKNNTDLNKYLAATPDQSYFEKHAKYDLYVDVYSDYAAAESFALQVVDNHIKG